MQQQASGIVGGGSMLIATLLLMTQLATGTVYQGFVNSEMEWGPAALFTGLACISGCVSAKFLNHCVTTNEKATRK